MPASAILRLDRRDLVEPAGGERQVGRGVGRQPRARTLDPDAPPLLARRAEQQRDGVGRCGSDARHAVAGRGDVHGVVAEQGADAVD